MSKHNVLKNSCFRSRVPYQKTAQQIVSSAWCVGALFRAPLPAAHSPLGRDQQLVVKRANAHGPPIMEDAELKHLEKVLIENFPIFTQMEGKARYIKVVGVV